MISIVGLAAASYLLGSLPTASLAARLVSTLGSRGTEALVRLLELLKGVLAVSLVGAGADPVAQAMAATAVVAGDQWPFRGQGRRGTGLATAAGALTVVTPLAVPAWGFLWALGYVASGYRAAGTVAATLLLPLLLGVVAGWPFGLIVLPACLMVAERRRDSLRRILLGTEPKDHWRSGS